MTILVPAWLWYMMEEMQIKIFNEFKKINQNKTLAMWLKLAAATKMNRTVFIDLFLHLKMLTDASSTLSKDAGTVSCRKLTLQLMPWNQCHHPQ